MGLSGKMKRESSRRTAIEATIVAVKVALRVKKDDKRLFSLWMFFAGLTAIPGAERAVCGQDIIVQFCPWDLAQIEICYRVGAVHGRYPLIFSSTHCYFQMILS
jgi:hypothetical protein